MTAPKRVFVYRVDIIAYPAGCNQPGWKPACWLEPDPAPLLVPSRLRALHGIRLRRALARQPFYWPAPRLFLSSSGAWFRAWRLHRYGAVVQVVRSDPVTWPAERDGG